MLLTGTIRLSLRSNRRAGFARGRGRCSQGDPSPPGSSARPLSSTRPAVSGMCPGGKSLRSLPSSCISLLGCLVGRGCTGEGCTMAPAATDGGAGALGMSMLRPRLPDSIDDAREAAAAAAAAAAAGTATAAAAAAANPVDAASGAGGSASGASGAEAGRSGGMGASCSLVMASRRPEAALCSMCSGDSDRGGCPSDASASAADAGAGTALPEPLRSNAFHSQWLELCGEGSIVA